MTPSGAGPIRLVVVQPTPFCNVACSYCYLPDRGDARRMDFEVVDAIAERVLSSPLADDPISLVWHAGEPLVLPIAWYEEAFRRLLRPGGPRLRHSIQTNGLAINDRWLAFFRKWDVRVGVSIDGPRQIHDRFRRTRRGGGTFEAAIAGLRRLRAAGYPFHVITVLTQPSLAEPDALFDFYVGEGIGYVCFNVEEKEGVNAASTLSEVDATERYARFLRRFAERMRQRPGALHCREVGGIATLVAGTRESRRYNPQVVPLEILSIGVEGAMSTFSPELLGARSATHSNFVFGNVLTDRPEDIVAHHAFRRVFRDIEQGVAACARTCAYFGVCGGGAPANKYFENGSFASTETLYCRLTRKTVVDVLLSEFEAHATDRADTLQPG